MKNLHITGLLAFACLLLFSCKKENSPTQITTPPPTQNTPAPPKDTILHLVRIQEGIDPDINKDTVYLLSYDSAGKITKLVDSLKKDTLVASYDISGNLLSVVDMAASNNNASFSYDGNNNLTQVDYILGNSNGRYTYSYTNGLVSQENSYSSTGSNPLKLQTYYAYTITDSNITTLGYYLSGGIHLADIAATYNSQANPFRALALFNFGNRLGLQDLAPMEAFFNKNIVATLSSLGLTASSTNTFDSKQHISEVDVNDGINKKVIIWQFTFK